ncbi:MAG: hypothetical protein ACI85F_002230 [Bacteroidia bacterium]|jgi:hypothetical protein
MRTKVVYILGLGRSGTTLLDIVLGNMENAISCGELNRYPSEEGRPYQYPKDHSAQKLWIGIKEEFDARYPNTDWNKMAGLHRQFEFHGQFTFNYLGLYNKTKFSEYLDFVESVYELIAEKTGQAVLIDSSKYSSRALSIGRSEKIDVAYLYIKRRPSSVVASFAKKDVEQNSKSWFGANLYYFMASKLCHLAFWRLKGNHRAISVRYEDLMNDPKKYFGLIGEKLDVDASGVIGKLNSSTPFSGGTIYYGNRVRLQKEVTLRPASKKPTGMGAVFSDLINFIWY